MSLRRIPVPNCYVPIFGVLSVFAKGAQTFMHLSFSAIFRWQGVMFLIDVFIYDGYIQVALQQVQTFLNLRIYSFISYQLSIKYAGYIITYLLYYTFDGEPLELCPVTKYLHSRQCNMCSNFHFPFPSNLDKKVNKWATFKDF